MSVFGGPEAVFPALVQRVFTVLIDGIYIPIVLSTIILPLSFALSFLAAIVVSLTDKKGQTIIAQAQKILNEAKA